MIPILRKLLWDESAFQRYARAFLFLVGELVRQGVIPTGIEGGGKYGVILQAIAFLVTAREWSLPPEANDADVSSDRPFARKRNRVALAG